VLATTASLVQTDNELLGPWLEEVGAPKLVEYQVFDEPEVVQRPDLVLEKVDCGEATVIRRAGSGGPPCPEPFNPALDDELKEILTRLRAADDPAEEERLKDELKELHERSDALNRANPNESAR
jgi:hypothetical protein